MLQKLCTLLLSLVWMYSFHMWTIFLWCNHGLELWTFSTSHILSINTRHCCSFTYLFIPFMFVFVDDKRNEFYWNQLYSHISANMTFSVVIYGDDNAVFLEYIMHACMKSSYIFSEFFLCTMKKDTFTFLTSFLLYPYRDFFIFVNGWNEMRKKKK